MMPTDRRAFLCSAVSAALPAFSQTPPRVCLIAPSPAQAADMIGLFQDLGLAVDIGFDAADPQTHALLWLVAPAYPEPAELPPAALMAAELFWQAGGGVFAEFVTNFPAAPAGDRTERTGIARLFVANALPFPSALPVGTILDEHDSMCLPLRAAAPLLSFGRVAGVRNVIPRLMPADTWPGLVAGPHANGRFAFAATSVSEFRRRQYAPVAHWRRFLRELVLYLLPQAARPASLPPEAPPPNRTSPIQDRPHVYLRALARNISWFERSGALLAPDGSLGVAEWISGPDIEGRRIAFGTEQMFSPERADCVFESALAFWMFGRLASSPRHSAIGETMLARMMDFQRLERGDPGYGLWNTRGRTGPAFQDDTSWATILSLAGHHYLGNRAFLRRGLLSAQAQLRAFGPDDRLRVPESSRAGSHARLTSTVDQHPHSGGCVVAAWFYAYGVTGDRAYLNAARPALDRMIDAFPGIRRYIISRTCESSRFLLPLSLGWHYTREPRYLRALQEQARYLRSRMAPCGAIQEDGSNAGNSVEGGDLGLTYDPADTVSDQLYTTSFAAMNLWIAYKATGDQAYLGDFQRLTDYLVRIQISSPDPRIDGGWMRGFDYTLWEYYGSNADQWWNAYVMETGWQNAIIDLALALYLSNDPFFVR